MSIEFDTWIQMDIEEQMELLENSQIDDIMNFINRLCISTIKKSKYIVQLIDKKRLLYHKVNAKRDMKYEENDAMKRMCELCKAEMDE